MIYIFGKGKNISIVYDGSHLNEQDKVGGLPFEKLPPVEEKEGFITQLYLNDNNELSWEYVEIPKDTLETLVKKDLLTKEQYKTLTKKDYLEE
jgi:hypothetical protein